MYKLFGLVIDHPSFWQTSNELFAGMHACYKKNLYIFPFSLNSNEIPLNLIQNPLNSGRNTQQIHQNKVCRFQ